MKIVLTGGPSAGKTVIGETIVREFRERIAMVPESASILFRGGFPRGTGEKHIMHQQKAIYYTQVELEKIVEDEAAEKLIICDRGTLDGLAYWPSGHDDFFAQLGTSMTAELRRYDFVFHLETAPSAKFDYSNPIRIETPELAKKIDEKIKSVWSSHSQRIIIKNSCLFSEKSNHVLTFINELLKKENL